jgi:hypothetical protein
MTNKFYNYVSPVVAGSTIRSDKYNSDKQGIDAAFESVEQDLLKRITLPATFTGNPVIPDVTVSDSFMYINPAGDLDLYSGVTLRAQFDDMTVKYDQVNVWQSQVTTSAGEAAASAASSAAQVTLATDQVSLAANEVALAITARDLAQEFASKNENSTVTGTSEFSAKHWAKKAEGFADEALATTDTTGLRDSIDFNFALAAAGI